MVVLKYPDYGVKLYGNTVIANQKFIDANPQAITGFLRAFTKGIRDVVADPDGAIQYVKQRDPLIDEALEKRRLKLAIDTVIATPALQVERHRRGEQAQARGHGGRRWSTPSASRRRRNTDTIFNSSFLPSPGERQVFRK